MFNQALKDIGHIIFSSKSQIAYFFNAYVLVRLAIVSRNYIIQPANAHIVPLILNGLVIFYIFLTPYFSKDEGLLFINTIFLRLLIFPNFFYMAYLLKKGKNEKPFKTTPRYSGQIMGKKKILFISELVIVVVALYMIFINY
jgi:hypothetical protein